MKQIFAYGIGLIFGIGISISGMANPAKVINFFDVAGFWDPSLACVMGGALFVTFMGYRLVFHYKAPSLSWEFVPPTSKIDRRLVGGAATFGVGWGIAGFCPGGALPALGTGISDVFLFTASLSVGIVIAKNFQILSSEKTDL